MDPRGGSVVDHCTLFPEGNWGACCLQHDIDYADITIARLTADLDLAACVAAVGGWPMAALMFAGVTAFGWFFRWRWFRRNPTTTQPGPRAGLFHADRIGDPAMSQEATFRAKAPWIMEKLLADFPIGVEDAAAIVGNLGHESGGFALMQELKPTVAGSRGGYGWAQWTGPRRRSFEAYCERNGLDPASDKANYAWLFLELKGEEKRAIAAVVGADGLDDKVEAFERAYERAGVKHYPSRKVWARRALDLWEDRPQFAPVPEAVPIPTPRPGTLTQPPVIINEPAAPDTRPANPSPTPVEQASKAVGAGKWAALAAGVWQAVIVAGILPAPYDSTEFSTAIMGLIATAAAIIGSYRAPMNATPEPSR